MSTNSKKNPRKTKLVPRMYVENEDDYNTDKQMSAIKIVDVKTVAAESFEAPQSASHLHIAAQQRFPHFKASTTMVSLLKTSQMPISQPETCQSRVSQFKTPLPKVSQLKTPQTKGSHSQTPAAVVSPSQSRVSLLKTSSTKVSRLKSISNTISQTETAVDQPGPFKLESSHIPFSISVNVEVEEFDDEDRLQIDERSFENRSIKMEIDDDEKIETEMPKKTKSDDCINFQNIVIKQERISPERESGIADDTAQTDVQSNITVKTEKEDEEIANQFSFVMPKVNVHSNQVNKNNVNTVNSSQVAETDVDLKKVNGNNENSNQIASSNVCNNVSNQMPNVQVLIIPNIMPNQYLVSETQILAVCEKILATSINTADKILAIEARNIIGRIAKEKSSESNAIDSKIQYALDDWKNWTAGSRRPPPLLYKCYLCLQSWWYLSEYRDHLLQHTETSIKVSVEETSVEECNIISYIDMVPEILDVEPNGACWRCENDFSVHKLSNRQSECYYTCKKCTKQFYSCTGLREHEYTSPSCSKSMGTSKCFLCPHMSPTSEARTTHMVLKHSVRTDLPIPASYKRCNDCGSKYFIYNMHNCRNKICSSQCNFCFRKFTHRLLAELHMSIDNSAFKCRICTLSFPKKCMELEHVLMHSTTFIFPYKCITCEDFNVYLDENVGIQHRYIKHKQKYDKKKNYLDKVLVPISCILPTYESADQLQTANDNVDVHQNISELTLIPEIKLEIIGDDAVSIKQEPLEELIIKEENTSDEEYEDDIIRLNFEYSDQDRNRSQPKMYRCRKCPFEGTHKIYKEHLMTKCGRSNKVMNEPKVYSCIKCNFQGHHSVYKEHLKSDCSRHVYINDEVYTCTKCDTTFDSIKRYLAHFVCHNYKYQQCPVCLMYYDSFSTLIIHFNSHIRQSFLKVYSIQSHNDASQRSNQISMCKKCSGEVTLEGRFVHWEKHLDISNSTLDDSNGEVPIVVDEDDGPPVDCTKNYSGLKPEMLEILIAKLQCELKKRIRDCPQCFRKFNRNNDCKRHFIEHLLSDAYSKWPVHGGLQCQICHEQHRKADRYKRHMRDHGCLPIFQCDVCDKAFSDSSNFTKHKKVHNMKVLICDLCNKKFQAKISLIKHMEMHKLSQPVSCDLCNREFPTDTLYRRHMRTRHDNSLKRNYKCVICQERFYTCKEKWEHSWEVHKERKYKADCTRCGKSFRTLIALKRHDKLSLCKPLYIKNNSEPIVNTKTFHFDNSVVVWSGPSRATQGVSGAQTVSSFYRGRKM